MKVVSLFEHNEKAYKKLNKTLENKKCATINHATGTGKSFIALKYLYENRNKKFLYLAPTYEILDQLMNDCNKIGITPEDINVDTMIYKNLLKMNMDEIYEKYDGIILDEYHRAGAKETYKQIKKLKFLLDNSKDDKKIIGLTATPIRYLDRARNMTKELFDGIVASVLSLSEAMLERILPVPMYINSKIACREEYQKVLRKVNRLADSPEKNKFLKRMEKTANKINNGEKDNKDLFKKYIKEKNGKYIIFCDNIRKLDDNYEKVDYWFSDIGEVQKYKVHSGQKREKNKEELAKFNSDKKGLSVLLCVDILNEGVHVDDIDGVILLRKTMSPIIYFQQIGRALSFSGRNKQIKIFDLVNNFKNHDAIYEIYRELEEELKRKIKENPEKKDKYQKILDRFVILDETKEIVNELNDISKIVTPEKIVESKINYSIGVLKKYINDNKSKGKKIGLYNDENVKKAYYKISKYYKHVTNTQLKELLELDILLPEPLMMTWQEREKLLSGYQSIQEREKNESSIIIEEYIRFLEENLRKPNLENLNEKVLLQKYLGCLPTLDDEVKDKIKTIMQKKNITFESYEKLLLNVKINSSDVDEIILLSEEFSKKGEILPDYLLEALNEFSLNYNTSKNEEVYKLIKYTEALEEEIRIRREEERQERIKNIISRLESSRDAIEEDMLDDDLLEQIEKLNLLDRAYIRRYYFNIKKDYYKTLIHNEENMPISEFCKRISGIQDKDILNTWKEKLQTDKKMYAKIFEIADFIENNNGNFPRSDGKEKERKLARDLEKYIEEGKVQRNFLQIGVDFNSLLHSSTKAVKSISTDNENEIEIKQIIIERMIFFEQNERKPLRNSDNEYEKKIADKYEELCIPYLGKVNDSILNKRLNRNKHLKKTCNQYIQNIKKIKEREEEK